MNFPYWRQGGGIQGFLLSFLVQHMFETRRGINFGGSCNFSPPKFVCVLQTWDRSSNWLFSPGTLRRSLSLDREADCIGKTTKFYDFNHCRIKSEIAPSITWWGGGGGGAWMTLRPMELAIKLVTNKYIWDKATWNHNTPALKTHQGRVLDFLKLICVKKNLWRFPSHDSTLVKRSNYLLMFSGYSKHQRHFNVSRKWFLRP